jgi:hypothetical protein
LARLGLLTGLLAACALPVSAQTVYVDAQGRPHESPVTATKLAGGRAISLNSGWYLCDATVNYTDTLTISGAVNLILGDDCTMHVIGNSVSGAYSAGIKVVGSGNSFTIWAERANSAAKELSSSTSGHLTVSGGYASAGIGGGMGDTVGMITINGGTVNATGGGGAGIGSGYKGAAGVIIINGGSVNAVGSFRSAGIGDGEYGYGGTVTVNGGVVHAESGYKGGAGIGGGVGKAGGTIINDLGFERLLSAAMNQQASGTITISGGTVNATGDGAGIGGNWNGAGSFVRITGNADVTAEGRYGGAGIGGRDGNAGMIVIATSGKVLAKGGEASDSSGVGAAIGQSGRDNRQMGVGISPIPNPADITAAAGGDAVFRVTVARTAHWIAYQWQRSTNGGESWSRVVDGPGVSGATKAALKLSGVTANMNGNLYRCVARVWGIGENSAIIYTTGPGRLTVK